MFLKVPFKRDTFIKLKTFRERHILFETLEIGDISSPTEKGNKGMRENIEIKETR